MTSLYRQPKLWVGLFLAGTGIIAFAAAGHAEELTPTTVADYGPPPGHGSVTCQSFAFDPDPGVLVTAWVTLDGFTFPADTQPGNILHSATFQWKPGEKFILNKPGPHHYSIALTWTAGTGTTTVTGDITCVDPPPTTTTTAPPETTTVPPTSPTTAPPVVATVPPPAPPTSSGGMLPHTGTDTAPLTVLGALLVSAGVVAVRARKAATR